MGDLPLPQQPTSAQKRPHSSVPARSAQMSPESQSIAPGERHIAGNKRIQQYHQNSANAAEPSQDISAYSLPIYTQELGRLPVHPSICAQVPQTDSTCPTGWNPSFLAYHPPAANVAAHRTHMSSPSSSLDPAFEALVSMLAPAQYQQPALQQHSPLTPVPPPAIPQNFPSFVHNQALHTIINHHPHRMPTDGDGGGFQQAAPEPLDHDALAMWSAAPSSLA